MKIILHRWLLLLSLSITLAEDNPDLPLCPTNLEFFPQKLPMHCRLPRSANPGSYPEMPQFPTLPPLPESFFRSLPPDKQPPPIPIPIPPFPGMPGGLPMPGTIGGPMPGIPGMPGAMPMPMPVVGGPPHKLPVIVMPFYSQDHSFKKPQTKKPPHKHHDKKKKKRPPHKKKKKHSESETDSSCEDTSESDDDDDKNSSSEHGFWKGRRKTRRKNSRRFNREHKLRRMESKNKKKNLLTPILQYVTKDGYVIFEKEISKNEAKDWLKPQAERPETTNKNLEEKPTEKPQEDMLFNPKSAEEFFRLDEEEKHRKSMELKEMAAAENQAEPVTKKSKKHRPLRFNPITNNNNQ